jgi:hypothetical protein
MIAEYISISLIPNAPASYDQNLHEVVMIVSVFSILEYVMSCQIRLTSEPNCSPETLTETAFKTLVLEGLFRAVFT